MKTLVLIALFLPFVVMADTPEALYKRVTETKSAKDLKALKDLCRSKNEEIKIRALCLYSAYRLSQGKSDYLKLLKEYSNLEYKNTFYPQVKGALAYYLLHLNEDKEAALRALKYFEKGKDLSEVLALEAWGDCLFEEHKFKIVKDYYEKALKLGSKLFPLKKKNKKDKYGYEIKDKKPVKKSPEQLEWERTKKRLLAKLKNVERQLEILKYGLEFVLYKEGMALRSSGKYIVASRKFGHILRLKSKTPYNEAAKFYLCINKKPAKLDADNIKYLKTFIDEDKDGLYRGEALLKIADIYLFNLWDYQNASKYYDQSLNWTQKVRTSDRIIEELAVPEKSREISRPPVAYVETKSHGEVALIEMSNNNLVNRNTAPWYLNFLEENSRYGVAYCHIINGDFDKVEAVIEPILEFNSHERKSFNAGYPSTYMTIHMMGNLKKTLIEKDDFELIKPALKTGFVLADFLYIQKRFDQALILYDKIIARAKKMRNDDAVVIALRTRFYVDPKNHVASHGRGVDYFKKIIETYPKSKALASVYISIANCYMSSETDKEELGYYKKAMEIAPGTIHAKNAKILSISNLLRLNKTELALKYAKEVIEIDKSSPRTVDWMNSYITTYNKRFNKDLKLFEEKGK